MMIQAISKGSARWLWGAALGFLVMLAVGILTEQWWIIAVPLAILGAGLLIRKAEYLYFSLFFLLPFSSDMDIIGGSQLAIPSEPLMILLSGVGLLWWISGRGNFQKIALHPISIFLMAHLGWMVISTLTTTHPLISGKFFLAKLWFVGAFYVGTWMILQSENKIKTTFWLFYGALMVTVLYVFSQHMIRNLEFDTINQSVGPFYMNHVDYATIMVLFYPLLWVARKWYPTQSAAGMAILFGLAFLPIAIYFSYTRAAIGILLLYPFIFLVLHFRLTKWAILGSLITAVVALAYLFRENEYLEYAPNYERTIYRDEFGNLLEATYQLEDLSTMERLYRWVAAKNMLSERPLTGFGPGTFYSNYKSYTVSDFRTYVSHNPEKSGVHNYYLMTLIEQGWPGLVLWLLFIFFALWYIERLYHRQLQANQAFNSSLVGALFCMFVALLIINIPNDMIENFQVGFYFFWVLGLIVVLDHQLSRSEDRQEPGHSIDFQEKGS